jgi:hypothetical protein
MDGLEPRASGPTHPSRRSYVRTYTGVRRHDAHAFVERAVRRAGGSVLWSSGPDVAPLYLAVEDPDGLRCGLMAYVFTANRRLTRNRPTDEQRMQIRYGDVDDPDWRGEIHPVGVDPTAVDVTLVLGAHEEADLLVALDPLRYDPLPMGISVFWKDADAEAARRVGWHVWERDNLSGVRRATPRTELGVETLIAFAPERLFDFLAFEHEAQSLRLDPPLRYRAAQRAGARPGLVPSSPTVHVLEEDYGLPAGEILEIIGERARLAMAVRGGVAEHHAGRVLDQDVTVTRAVVGHQEGPPDYFVQLRDGRALTVEVKNASPTLYADGTPKVEVQKTRASRSDPLSRLYTPEAFDLLAACMWAPTGDWTFKWRRSNDLVRHPDHPDRIRPIQRITSEWADCLSDALD